MPSLVRRLARAGGLLALVAAAALPLGAQADSTPHPAPPPPAPADTVRRCGPIVERLNLDRLRLSAIGLDVGAVKPAQTRATSLVSLHTDYGEIGKGVHVVFTATYWGSHLTNATMAKYAAALRQAIVDTTNDYRLDLGRVSVSDIALGTDFRWFPRPAATLRPYLGGGLAVHVINAEGKAIAGTFVERALDNIAVGTAALAGADLHLGRSFDLGMQARFDLVSGVRFGALRFGGSYIFDQRAKPLEPGRSP